MSHRRKSRRPDAMARNADKYRLYQESVQDPESDVSFAQRIFKKRYARPARLLREDFCGAAAVACRWVASHRENRAFGVDIDPEPLAWGREHNVALLSQEQSDRLELIEGDVLTAEHELVDVTVAFNFSYFLFQKRRELVEYLAKAKSTLREEGLLILDLYGGADAMRTMSETREQEGFDYVWDQHRFDPVNNNAINYIHFEFPDGSRIHRAFHYDWRLWTMPEVHDVLEEVGFSDVEAYWEGTDQKTNEGNGIYHKVSMAPDDPAWVSYLVAVR